MFTIVYQDNNETIATGYTAIEALNNLIEALNSDCVDTDNRVIELRTN